MIRLILVCGILSATVLASEPKRGIVVTAPKTWLVNREEQVCVSFHGIDFDVATMTSIIWDVGAESATFTSQKVNFNQGTGGCFRMSIEGFTGTASQATLKFTAESPTADPPYNFSKDAKIYINNFQDAAANITFIELDKPLYKPGDVVQFRVLTINEDLKPRTEKYNEIYIENPSGVRLMQWKDIDVVQKQGFADFNLELSSDPQLGEWKINVVRNDGSRTKQIFKVEEYVLPKFEVEVRPPAHLPVTAETVEAQVCAHYTYGEPVKGNLTVNMCMRVPYWYYSRRYLGCHKFSAEVSGCHKFDIPIHELVGNSSENLHSVFVEINATMEEEDTGVVMNATKKTAAMSYKIYDIDFKDCSSFFKPGLPYTGKIVVKHPDGKPAVGTSVRVGVSRTKEPFQTVTYTTDSMGEVHLSLTGLEMDEKENNIMIEAEALISKENEKFSELLNRPTTSFSAKPWYSPSDSYLSIDELDDNVDCGGDLQAHISYNQGHNHHVQVEVTAQNSIILEDDVHHSHGEDGININLALPDGIWGEASLLVYYVRRDGEIVADSAKFKIGYCVKNHVEFGFSGQEVAPGRDIDVVLRASPGSLCAYGVVDESIKLLGGDQSMTMAQILKKLPSKSPAIHYGYMDYTDTYCQNKIEEEEEEEEEEEDEEEDASPPGQLRPGAVGPPGGSQAKPGQGIDNQPEPTTRAPRRKGRKRGKGRKRNRRPRMIAPWPRGAYSKYADSSEAFKNPGVLVLTDLTLETRPCDKREEYPEYYRHAYMSPGQPGPGGEVQFSDVQFNPPLAAAPPNAVFDSVLEETIVEPDNAAHVEETIRSFFPETWLWELVPIGEGGYSSITHKAPDTITEWTGHAVCSSQEAGLGISGPAVLRTFQPFFVSFTMPYSVIRGETLHMPVSVFNYLTECLVIELELKPTEQYRVEGGSTKRQVCVCGQEKKTQTFPITALALGDVNVTVKAESVSDAMVCGNMIMSSQIGVRDIVIRPLLVEAEGKAEEFSHSAYMCPKGETLTESVELILPDDLVEGSLQASVSAMGDIMGPALSGLDSLLALPTGCGEQNMLKFSPNIFILQYLTNAGLLSEQIETKALGFLRTGYQRELQYRHRDGSYSAFGENDDSGSTWLTAFVLKSFAEARPFINIDQQDLQKTRDWFLNNKLENGCFRNVGRIIHKSMKGGLSSDQESLAPLTAYVLVALLESDIPAEDPLITEAIGCINAQEYSDAYTAALVSYALTRWSPEDPITRRAVEKLDSLKTETDGKAYWYSGDKATPADIETAAYALLTYIHATPQPQMSQLLPVVRFLTSQRNPNGGFLSTQDTVVGLQALAKFAELVSSDSGDVTVKVTETSSNTVHEFSISDDTKLLLQRAAVNAPTPLTFEVEGESGCVFIQASMKYNILDVTKGTTPSVQLSVAPSRLEKETDCRLRKLRICTEYEGPDDQTSMVLVDVKMVSGWIPDEESVYKLKQDTTLNIGCVEMEKKNVYLYFNELFKDEEVCLEFIVIEDIKVTNVSPGSVTVYDYYDPNGVFIQKEYTLRSICGTKEEIPFGFAPPENLEDIVQVRQPIGTPPPLIEPEERVEETACPLCLDATDDLSDLEDQICNAQHVYRGVVKRNGVIKVHKDLKDRGRINKVVSTTLPDNCDCSPLQSGGQWVWLVTMETEITKTNKKKSSLDISGSDVVMAVPQKAKKLEKRVKQIRRSRSCRRKL